MAVIAPFPAIAGKMGNRPTALAFAPLRVDNGVVFAAGDRRGEYHTGPARDAPRDRTACKGCAVAVFFGRLF
jgi:hypothetical protein